MHPKEIEAYFKLLKKTDISELEIDDGNQRLRIVRAIGDAKGVSGPVIVSHAAPVETPAKTGCRKNASKGC